MSAKKLSILGSLRRRREWGRGRVISDSSWGLGKDSADRAQSPFSGTPRAANSSARSPHLKPLRRRLTATTFVISTVAVAFAISASPALALTTTTTSATAITFNSATLNGSVDPQGVQLTECHFEYLTDAAFHNGGFGPQAKSVPCVPAAESIPPDSTEHPVSAKVTGLTAGVEYHFRLATANGAPETVNGSGQTFTSRAAHLFSTSFAGSGASALLTPDSVAIDQSTNDVFVSDPAAHRVEEFTSTGEFILMFGKDVDQSTGSNVCTAESHDTCQVGTAASTPGAFSSTSQLWLTVDNSDSSSSGDVYVGDPGDNFVSKFDASGQLVESWGKEGQLDGSTAPDGPFSVNGGLEGVGIGSAGTLYIVAKDELFKFAPDGAFSSQQDPQFTRVSGGFAVDPAGILYGAAGAVVDLVAGESREGKNPNREIAPFSGSYPIDLTLDPATRDLFVTFNNNTVVHYAASCTAGGENCSPVEAFGAADLKAPNGLAIDDSTGDVYVADSDNHRVAVFTAVPYLPNATNLSAKSLTPTSESISGKIDPAGAGPVTACHFEYGETTAYGSGPLPCSVPTPIESPTEVSTATNLEGLTYATAYRFHLVTENANGENASYYETFTTLPNPPAIGATSISEVHADAALVNSQINPGGAASSYQVEYVTQEQFEAAEFHGASQSPSFEAESARKAEPISAHLSGLSPGTTYHYRVIATNADNPNEPSQGPVHTFTTLPFIPPINDPCPNAHVRQQTGAAQLLDCRAYELVSAANSDGYDVESNLIAGQVPYPGYPEAQGKVLYAVHDGGIPGTNHPTNRGPDPYVATRTENGWSTEYVGVPANNPFSAAPFTSIPSGADAKLETFAFGGFEGCSPCFSGGYTGIPVRKPNGELTQGMASTKGFTEPGARRQARRLHRQTALRQRRTPDLRIHLCLCARRQRRNR